MTSKETILQSIRQYKYSDSPELPDLSTFESMQFEDNFTQFETALQSVGGKAIVLEGKEHLDESIKAIYPEAQTIASNINTCKLSTINANSLDNPHDLASVDLAIVKGEFAVAENGAVWIKNPDNRHRALYFLAENIVIVVPRGEIVPTMHQAYERVSFEDAGFGVFVSGPSKTADIEQSLVIGAHGPKSGYVFFV
jgi:L-lactate dehydrogenase complex protein LldG